MSPNRSRFPLILIVLAGLSALPVGAQTDLAKATPVGSEICLECHELEALGPGNVHMRIEPFEVQGRDVGCESCHGPGSLHSEEADPALIRGFADGGYEASEVCVSCHRSKRLHEWEASVHALEEVACDSCHSVHQAYEPEATCQECHAESVAAFQLPSHHPLREGKMECSSCHDVHASTEAMLKTRRRPNDLCFTCHQAQEGPFIFEHEPVQEDCSLCHQPHGSVVNNLLVANEPMLCLQCHEFHFHAGYRSADAAHVDVGGFERENPFGAQGFNIAFTTSCTQCHARIHGSDTPNQTVTGRGAMTQ